MKLPVTFFGLVFLCNLIFLFLNVTKVSYISFLCIILNKGKLYILSRIIFYIKKQCYLQRDFFFFGKLDNNSSINLFESRLKQKSLVQSLKSGPQGHLLQNHFRRFLKMSNSDLLTGPLCDFCGP